MKRRTFLIGTGGTALGGSALLGTGAFSRVESQRRVKIEVAEDPDAYLGLDGCPDSPNRSYTKIDGSGHLAVEMSPENPTEGGGTGVNSDSRTWFDRVFQLCNQGKQGICIWIRDDEDWPRVPESFDDEGDRRVDFYLEDDPEQSIIGEENAIPLAVGECVCIGIRTNTKGLTEGDQLLEDLDDEIVIHADEDCPIEVPPEETGEICGEKRLTDELREFIEGLENGNEFDPDNPRAGWEIELTPDPAVGLPPITTTTDENGQYCFTGLPEGTHTVCEVLKPGAIQIEPEDGACYEVELGEGESVDGKDFKNDFDDDRPAAEPRTIGFWSNWSGDCTPGGQDNVLGDTLKDASGIVLGDLTVTKEDHADPPNCGAVNLLGSRDLGGAVRANDGAYNLASQLLAAKLNEAAGADVPGDGSGEPGDDCGDVRAQIDAGQALLDELEFDGTETYLPPQSDNRQEALDIATCLDRYNNGEFT